MKHFPWIDLLLTLLVIALLAYFDEALDLGLRDVFTASITSGQLFMFALIIVAIGLTWWLLSDPYRYQRGQRVQTPVGVGRILRRYRHGRSTLCYDVKFAPPHGVVTFVEAELTEAPDVEELPSVPSAWRGTGSRRTP